MNWQVKSESIAADGVIYAVLPNEEAEIQQTADVLQNLVMRQKICLCGTKALSAYS